MDIHAGQQRRFPAVAMVLVLLALCIYPGQYLLTKQFPQIAGLAQFKPQLVFLEIPVQLPFVIDLVLAPVLFLLMYPLVMLFYPSCSGKWHRFRAAVTGLFTLLCCVLIGGLIYYLVQGHLTPEVQTGINSMGFMADIHVAYPGYETIALRGSMVLFICFIIGLVILIRKLRKEPPTPLTREQRMTPYERMLQERKMNKGIQEQRKVQPQEHTIDNNRNTRNIIPVEQPRLIQQDRNGHSFFCYNQPIRIFKPEAMYFMPK
jgi:hypothetical protein